MDKINHSVPRNREKKNDLPHIGPKFMTSKLDAGGKPSTLFPPGGLVKLTATPSQVNARQVHAKHDADHCGP